MGRDDGGRAKAPINDEEQPLLAAQTRVYAVRWYILFMASLMAFLQGCSWNAWGPIAPALKPVLGWGDGAVAMLANWGPISFLIGFFPSAYLMQVSGLRAAMVAAALLVFTGAGARCITLKLPDVTYLTHFGQFLNGLAGPVAMAAPPVLSSTWFPLSERATATAIMAASNYFGVATAFLLGPYLVPDRTDGGSVVLSPEDRTNTRNDIMLYNYIQFVAGLVLIIGTVVYFPSKPPKCPTTSAGTERTSFRKGFFQLLAHKKFWLVALAYGSCTGVYSGWGAYLAPNLTHVLEHHAQTVAAWLGFWSTIAGAVGSILLGWFADRIGRMKLLITVLCSLATIVIVIFSFVCDGVLPSSHILLYVSSIAGGFFINAAIPLFYETAVECTYPIAEATTTTVLTTLNNVFCLLFLIGPVIPGLGNQWVNWFLAGACALAVVTMLLFKEDYRRLSVDLA
eukprot:m.309662 g.309662  ORF g.309662 m.309662 type:complete len:454 (-) comp23486_c0_seq1:160-1521(-)